MHWQFHGVFKNPIYPRKATDVTKLTDFTDLQTYGFFGRPESYNFSPGAHPRTHAGYNTKRCGGAGMLRQLVLTRARTRNGGAASLR